MPQSLRADCAYPAASRILLFVREKRWSRALYVLPCMRVCVRDHIHTFDRFKKDLNCLEEDKRERDEGLHPLKKNLRLLRHFTECHSKFALSQRVYFMGVRVTTNEATSENGGIGGNGFEGSREEARIF